MKIKPSAMLSHVLFRIVVMRRALRHLPGVISLVRNGSVMSTCQIIRNFRNYRIQMRIGFVYRLFYCRFGGKTDFEMRRQYYFFPRTHIHASATVDPRKFECSESFYLHYSVAFQIFSHDIDQFTQELFREFFGNSGLLRYYVCQFLYRNFFLRRCHDDFFLGVILNLGCVPVRSSFADSFFICSSGFE